MCVSADWLCVVCIIVSVLTGVCVYTGTRDGELHG